MKVLGGGGIRVRAKGVLMLEEAATRGKRRQLPGPPWWWGENPSGQDGRRSGDPPRDAVLLTPGQMGLQTPKPRGAQSPAESPPQRPDLAGGICELQHQRPELKRRRSPPNNGQRNITPAWIVWDWWRQGTGQEATHLKFLIEVGPNRLRPHPQARAQEGLGSIKDRRCRHETGETENR